MEATNSLKVLTNRLSQLGMNKSDMQDLLVCLFLLRWVLDESEIYTNILNQSLQKSLNKLFFSPIEKQEINSCILTCIELLAQSDVYLLNQLDFSSHIRVLNHADASTEAVKWLRNVKAAQFVSKQDNLSFFDTILEQTKNALSVEFSSTKELSKLVVALAAPKKGESILDPCTGQGNFLLEARLAVEHSFSNLTTDTLYDGCERSKRAIVIATLRFFLAGISNFKLLKKDIVNENTIAQRQEKYDVIFAHPSQAIKRINYRNRQYSFSPFETDAIGLLIEQSLNALKKNGRAVIVIEETDICLSKQYKEKLRQFLLNSGYVEAVLKIPHNVFIENKNHSGLILLLNKKNNHQRVRFADLSTYFAPLENTTTDTLLTQRVKEIANVIRSDKIPSKFTSIVWDLTYKQIAGDNFNLAPIKPENHEFTVLLDSFKQQKSDEVQILNLSEIVDIKLGEKLVRINHSKTATPFGYIHTGDIENFKIKKVNDWLTTHFANKTRLKHKDILVSKKGTIGKLAIIDKQNAGFFAGNSLLILRKKEQNPVRLLPEYLLYYLASHLCQLWLDNKKTGGLEQSITQKDLGLLPVLLPSIEIQKRAINQYQSKATDIITFLNKSMLCSANAIIENLILSLESKIENLNNDKKSRLNTLSLLTNITDEILKKKVTKEELESSKEAFFSPTLQILKQFEGLHQIPPSLFLLNRLENISQQISCFIQSTAGNYQQEAKLIAIFSVIKENIEDCMAELLNNVVIDISPSVIKSSLASDKKYTIQLENQSYLPLKNIQIKSFPKLGFSKALYLADRDKMPLSLKLNSKHVDLQNIEIAWSAQTLAGKTVTGSSSIAIKPKINQKTIKMPAVKINRNIAEHSNVKASL